ncbi:Tetratricopeptide-like helical [Penicillium alfredii]|uniref:Tetratricopeptide-like helical n=1 Tax=Penicillium alfredii TaxID=1506179 RepID=A0A9W9GCJ1_9EURO|nr:Tetratricopeptide-like helical [Penicillium alfredii]KAJ5115460.1 Tetratricopeptide-like helical [Penicillium alfredii]
MQFSQALQFRADITIQLYADPHNPHLYLERGLLYEKLGFSDLAAADAYRALSLLESVVDPDGCEFHARRNVDSPEKGPSATTPGEDATNDSDDEDEDEDKDDGTTPITQEEYDVLVGPVYALLVRSLVRCGCYRDAFEFGVRGLGLLGDLARQTKEAAAAVTALSEQMEHIKQVYISRTDASNQLPWNAIDSSVLPAQGSARRVLYPWNQHEPDRRAPETLQLLNDRLVDVAPKCEVRAVALPALHDAIPDSSAEPGVSVQLGLFAKEDIAPDEIILRESSLLTATNRLHDDLCDACNAPLPELSAAEPPVGCEGGCADTVFCSQSCHDAAQRIYHGAICGFEDGLESIGKDIPDPKDKADYLYLLLLGRALAMSATQDVHALDLPEVKYIWGDFHDVDLDHEELGSGSSAEEDASTSLPFSFQLNILQPTRFLEEMGLDPYTTLPRYDTWVLNTLYAKFRGTASGRLSTWDGGPELCAVHPLWCLANHSCDPNVRWEWGGEITFRARTTAERPVWTRKDERKQCHVGGIAKDQEIVNHYCDVGLPVKKRREWACGALGGMCRCERCVWEAEE